MDAGWIEEASRRRSVERKKKIQRVEQWTVVLKNIRHSYRQFPLFIHTLHDFFLMQQAFVYTPKNRILLRIQH